MKVLAFYLPQFHDVKENNEWWGEGFTDWVPTKEAKPICEGHYQPHVPLNKKYYDLAQKSTMEWQAELMKKYQIDGMCMYHYYFKDGRKILEKPAENLLKWKDIDMPFCFYWANETWKRSWSNVPNANVWAGDSGKPENPNDTGVLLDQQYGDRAEWIKHFEYFLPFFKDERYIKVGGKPLVILYRTFLITCLSDMIACWQECARKEGFPGLYIIGAYPNDSNKKHLDGVLYHEPPQSIVTLREAGVGGSAYSITYSQMVEHVLAEPMMGDNTYFSCFTGFDDTPRRGLRGNALIDATPQQYETFLAKSIAKNIAAGNEFTFINAWNEWGEGMHLEPDEKYGYAFLEATKHAKELANSYVDEYKVFLKQNQESSNFMIMQKKADKFEQYMRLLDRWMELREQGIHISTFFKERGIQKIGIYGYGNFGRHLYWELKNSDVEVLYLIDQQGQRLSEEAKVYLPSDELPACDEIVVSTFWIFDEIRELLADKHRLIPLDEIVHSF